MLRTLFLVALLSLFSLGSEIQAQVQPGGQSQQSRGPQTPVPSVELLTPTGGVDLTEYVARMLASIKLNWYALMPDLAKRGESGSVVVQFHILRNGKVPKKEPHLVTSSSKGPLDRAALGSIRASAPFQPLPAAFKGPAIELRLTFVYNQHR